PIYARLRRYGHGGEPSVIVSRWDHSHAPFAALVWSFSLLDRSGSFGGAFRLWLWPVSVVTASLNLPPSRNCTRAITSPFAPHPRQLKPCCRILTPKRSRPPHSGHGPISSAPTRLSLMSRRATSSSILA